PAPRANPSVHHRHRALITPRAERPRITPGARYRRKDPTGGGRSAVPDVRPARAGDRAVRDCTLVAWYRSIYAPPTGGAYDSPHRTAGIAGRTRRDGSRMAARGARAAADDASRRISQSRIGRVGQRPLAGLP